MLLLCGNSLLKSFLGNLIFCAVGKVLSVTFVTFAKMNMNVFFLLPIAFLFRMNDFGLDSVTFSCFPSYFRSQRTLLCYLFPLFLLFSVTENASLLPFSAFPLVFGHRERLSVTFFLFSLVFGHSECFSVTS